MELLNSFVTVTNIGGVFTNGGLARLLDPSVPTSGETYYWDDTTLAREGFHVVVPAGFVVQRVVMYGSPSYPMSNCTVEQNGQTLANQVVVNVATPMIWNGSMVGAFDVVRYGRSDQAATRLHVWGTRGKGLIKENGKYYKPITANYDTVLRMYTPTNLTDATITADNCDDGVMLGDLLVPVTIGDETFTPISKFRNFQIASTVNGISMSAIRRNASMIVTRKVLYPSGVKNIDNIVATGAAPTGSRIRIVLSDDDGVTWKTSTDKGVNWTTIPATVAKKNYSEMTQVERNSWLAAVTAFGASGLEYSTLSTVNFNQFNKKKIQFAVVIYQPDFTTTPSMKTITWQYDANDTYRRMRDTEIEVDIVDETTVKVTPLIDNSSIKVNISNG